MIGEIVQTNGSFVGALYFVGLVALVGAAAWFVEVGRSRPLAPAQPVP